MIENPGDLPRGNAWELQQARHRARHRAAERKHLRYRRACIFGAWIFSAFAAAYAIPPYVPHAGLLVLTNAGMAVCFWKMRRWA